MNGRMVNAAWLVLVGITLSACGAGGENVSSQKVREASSSTLSLVASIPTGSIPFAASLTAPLDGSRGVSVAQTIRIRFDDTPESATITLTDGLGAVGADLLCDGPFCELTPRSALTVDTDYRITVAAGSRSVNGNTLANSLVWDFSTGNGTALVQPLAPIQQDGGWAAGVRVSPQGETVSVAVSTDTVSGAAWSLSRAGSVFTDVLTLAPHTTHTVYADIVAQNGSVQTETMPVSIGWTDVTPGPISPLNDVVLLSSRLAWAVGDNGTVLKSEDGGHQWQTISLSGANLNALHFVTPSNGWAVGDFGTVLHLVDGSPWQTLSVATQATLNDILFVGADRGWLVGDAGTVRRSDDGGTTWATITVPTADNLNAITCADADRCHVVGDAGTVLITDDGGSNWIQTTPVTDANLNSISLLEDGNGWISAEGGILLAGDTVGNWRVRGTTGQSNLSGLRFAKGGRGWAAGTGNSVVSTTDGGINWQVNPLPSNASLAAISNLGSQQLLAVGSDGFGNGIILRTDTGGRI